MFTKKEKVLSLRDKIQEKFLDKKGLFLFNTLSRYELDSPIKKLLDFEFTYGSDEIFDFFILVNKERKGFIFTRSTYLENNRNSAHDILYTTKDFSHLKGFVETYFNTNELRDLFIDMLRTDDRSTINFSLNRVLSSLMFDSKVRKPQRMKAFGLFLVLLNNEMSNVYNKEIDNFYRDLYLNYLYKRDNFEEIDINKLVLNIMIDNIDYIVRNNININTIPIYLRENIL